MLNRGTEALGCVHIVVIKNLGSFYHTTPMRLQIGILHFDIDPTRLFLTFAACMMIYKTKKEIILINLASEVEF